MSRVQRPQSTAKVAVYDDSALRGVRLSGLLLLSLVVLLITVAT